jgi:hypothetical protein
MPDLADVLLTWEQAVEVDVLNRVLAALAALHREPWFEQLDAGFPWCDLGLRLNLLTRGAGARYEADGNPVGRRFLEGWDAFDRHAPAAACDLLDRLTNDWSPLRVALERLPSAGLHGDLKLGNVGLEPDGGVPMIDWQMTMVAPIAVELGWFLVSNVAGLPLDPDGVLDRYRTLAAQPDDEAWATQRDLAIIAGLRLRGWRKGLDADAGVVLPTGRTATADLAWWAEAAVEAADRRL